MNITGNKIGEKIKNKTDLQKSKSKLALHNLESNNKQAQFKIVESIIEG